MKRKGSLHRLLFVRILLVCYAFIHVTGEGIHTTGAGRDATAHGEEDEEAGENEVQP